MPRTYNEQMQDLVRLYRQADEEWPATLKHMSAWMIEQGLWEPPGTLLISKCAEDLGRALREEYVTDPQGRRVRAKHAARMDRDDGEQGALWDDMRTAPHKHMQVAFQQRRQGVVGDCHRLKIDVDSYNDNRSPVEPIQMSFDFTNDLLELEALDKANGAKGRGPSAQPTAPAPLSSRSLSGASYSASSSVQVRP